MIRRHDPGRVLGLRIWGLIRKETRQVVRDPSSVLIAVVLPLLLLVLFGYGVSFDPRRISIGLVVEQPTAETGSFNASLRSVRFFDIRTSRDRRAFEAALVAGRLNGIVVLEADFAGRAARGDTAPIQVIVDGSDPNNADLVRNYIQGAWANWLEQEALSLGQQIHPPVVLAPRVWFNPGVSSHHYLVPGSIAIILTLIGALLTALVVAREWERGTMEALLATPVGILELLIGKLVPYFALGLGAMALSVATAVLLFEVPFRGSFLLLALVGAVFLFTALGQGLLLSTVTRNQLAASHGALLSAFLPAFIFSGFVFEINSMPWPLPWISTVVPARYFISSLQTLFLAGNVTSVIGLDLLAMAIIGSVFFALTALKTKTRLE